jgi:hypothetical protein
MAEITPAYAPVARRRGHTGLVVTGLMLAALFISALGLTDLASAGWL